MKILHIIDQKYFVLMERTVTDTIDALDAAGVAQAALCDAERELPLPVGFQACMKPGFAGTLVNRMAAAKAIKTFDPDVVIRWGAAARQLRLNGKFADVSFAGMLDDFKDFDRATTVMANDEGTLRAARAHGFSGLKSFVLPPFCAEGKGRVTLKELFIPERAAIVFAAGLFAKGAGWEDLFDAFATLRETYFLIQGQGDLALAHELSSRAGVKSRCRFVLEIDKTLSLMKLADFAVLTAQNPEFAKFALFAARAGIPVLATEGRKAEEFIEDDKSGFLAPKNDIYLLKKKLHEIEIMDEMERARIALVLNEATRMSTAARAVECILAATYKPATKEALV